MNSKKEYIKGENPVGRPSELLETLEKAKEYLLGGYEKVGEVIPSVAGLACFTEKSRANIYKYGAESSEFKYILEGILRLQESKLLNSGLTGAFNATITKLILTKHGYSDKAELELGNIDNKPLHTLHTISTDPNVAAQVYADLMKDK